MKTAVVLFASLLVSACGSKAAGFGEDSAAPPVATPRPNRFVLEAVVNDYFLRMKAKQEFWFPFEYDYWTSVSDPPVPSVVVFVYVRPPLDESHAKFPQLRELIEHHFQDFRREAENGIRDTVLHHKEFDPYRSATLKVELRIEPRLQPMLEAVVMEKLLGKGR